MTKVAETAFKEGMSVNTELIIGLARRDMGIMDHWLMRFA